MSGTAVSPAAAASETLPSRSNSATTSAARSGSTRDVAAVARATARVREGSDGPFFTPAAAAASAARSRERVTSGSGARLAPGRRARGVKAARYPPPPREAPPPRARGVSSPSRREPAWCRGTRADPRRRRRRITPPRRVTLPGAMHASRRVFLLLTLDPTGRLLATPRHRRGPIPARLARRPLGDPRASHGREHGREQRAQRVAKIGFTVRGGPIRRRQRAHRRRGGAKRSVRRRNVASLSAQSDDGTGRGPRGGARGVNEDVRVRSGGFRRRPGFELVDETRRRAVAGRVSTRGRGISRRVRGRKGEGTRPPEERRARRPRRPSTSRAGVAAGEVEKA